MNNNALESSFTAEQADILKGLSASQKWINPKYFYDELGSQYFEKITRLEEYYPTRTELKIFSEYADEIADYIDKDAVIVEPGAGSCKKIQHLLSALKPKAYVPQDVSGDYLRQVVSGLEKKYPWLEISPLISDFSKPLIIPEKFKQDSKYIFYPGSTIGNFEPADAVSFLKNMHKLIGESGGIILGVDLQKDPMIIEAAYNDKQGITAKFNLNILKNINRHLEQDINAENFEHYAFYNSREHRIEMHLRAIKSQKIVTFGQEIEFKEGETIHTENSYKYNLEGINALAKQAGLQVEHTWLDKDELFSVNLLSPV